MYCCVVLIPVFFVLLVFRRRRSPATRRRRGPQRRPTGRPPAATRPPCRTCRRAARSAVLCPPRLVFSAGRARSSFARDAWMARDRQSGLVVSSGFAVASLRDCFVWFRRRCRSGGGGSVHPQRPTLFCVPDRDPLTGLKPDHGASLSHFPLIDLLE